jgi:hypothetical protein
MNRDQNEPEPISFDNEDDPTNLRRVDADMAKHGRITVEWHNGDGPQEWTPDSLFEALWDITSHAEDAPQYAELLARLDPFYRALDRFGNEEQRITLEFPERR